MLRLPFNQSTAYHILIDVNGGFGRHPSRVQVATLANVSLSKECFGIGMLASLQKRAAHVLFPLSLPLNIYISLSLSLSVAVVGGTDVAAEEPRDWPASGASSLAGNAR